MHLQEIFKDANTISIQVDGVLDTEALEVLKTVCRRHLNHRKILIDLGGVTHLGREARDYLREIRSRTLEIKLSSHFEI